MDTGPVSSPSTACSGGGSRTAGWRDRALACDTRLVPDHTHRHAVSRIAQAYADRVGTTRFEDEVRDLAMPVEFGLDTMNMFLDWDRNQPFQVIRGEGECAI